MYVGNILSLIHQKKRKYLTAKPKNGLVNHQQEVEGLRKVVDGLIFLKRM